MSNSSKKTGITWGVVATLLVIAIPIIKIWMKDSGYFEKQYKITEQIREQTENNRKYRETMREMYSNAQKVESTMHNIRIENEVDNYFETCNNNWDFYTKNDSKYRGKDIELNNLNKCSEDYLNTINEKLNSWEIDQSTYDIMKREINIEKTYYEILINPQEWTIIPE